MREVSPSTSLDGITTSLLQLPGPDLPKRAILVSSWVSKGAKFYVFYQPSGRLKFTAVEPNGETSFELTSCRLTVARACTCIITAIWSLPGKLELWISDTIIGSTMGDSPSVPEVYNVEAESDTSVIHDLSRQNADMVEQRGRPMLRQQRKHHLHRADIVTSFLQLKFEVLQIKDLLSLVLEGKLYHAVGLAARLRLLLAEKSKARMPLLQSCAAAKNDSLLVFTNKLTVKPPRLATNRSVMLNIRAHPDNMHRTPIDLDLWLDSAAGRSDGRSFSHKDLIEAIGNTVGAHVDQNLHPYVMMLRGFATELHDGSGVHDFLIQYVLAVARGVLPLAEGLVDRHHPTS